MTDSSDTNTTRKAILAQLDSLTAIARGSLAEEFREQPAPGGHGTIRLGPYYKHQVWADGRNHSARVPAACADRLREQLLDGKRFDSLTAQLAALALAQGAAQRDALIPGPVARHSADAKKNSAKNASRKGTAKQKPGSIRSARSSRRKG